MNKSIVLLPGDGIGPEVVESAKCILDAVAQACHHTFTYDTKDIGGTAIDNHQDPLPEETEEACKRADAVLLGAVGGPAWDNNPAHLRPEKGLLRIRKSLGLYANLRPVQGFPELLHASPLKFDVVNGSDLLIVRELTGGLYFGEPSERRDDGQSVVDTLAYTREEMERIIETGFEAAMVRKKHLTSVDKANVLESSKMWREIVMEKAKDFPEVTVDHVLVDAAAMKLITDPTQFDVMVTENMFGDILSDEASVLTGSLGMLPSASLRKDGFGLYEPAHGSAPDIAGQGVANPLATILSAAMMLRYSFEMDHEATLIEQAVAKTIAAGYHTADLDVKNGTKMGTKEITDKVIDYIAEETPTESIMRCYA